MTREELFENIKRKKSFLCIGLDTDVTKIPSHLLEEEDPVFEFNKQIIDSTQHLCIAYKPNTAFYETEGVKGWISLEKTINYIREKYPDQFTIADAKRGDIGNTSKMYAKAFLENLNFDSVTVAPYMGEDSVIPFMEYQNKWVILLALTSNPGSKDFQLNRIKDLSEKKRGEISLFENVLEISKKWSTPDNMMYVVGATKAEMLDDIRKIIPDSFLLVPGIGAQGGSLSDVAKFGMNKKCGLLVNSSRGILYAGAGLDFKDKARDEAGKLQMEMQSLLEKYL